MLPLSVDAETGFLQSPSVRQSTFTADKKLKFLELAMAERLNGGYPDIGLIADQVGINMRTVDRHLQQDTAFKEQWDEIVLRTEAGCMKDMYDLRKKNPMYMFGILRRLLPQRWNPDTKQTLTMDINIVSRGIDKANAYDAELTQLNNVNQCKTENLQSVYIENSGSTSTPIEVNGIKNLEQRREKITLPPTPVPFPGPSTKATAEKGPSPKLTGQKGR